MLLLREGHDVIGIDNLDEVYDVKLKRHRLRLLEDYDSFRFFQLDVADAGQLEKGFLSIETPSAVLSLAARSGVRQSVSDPWAYLQTNVTGTLNLLEFCRSRRVEKLVLASSSSVYGTQRSMPCREECETSLPLSPYAASKKAAEALCHAYHHMYGLDISILRYFTVYGPAGRPDMSVFRFVQRIFEKQPIMIYGDGSQTRDFTYVDDVARATVLALKKSDYIVLNVGSSNPVCISDVIALVEEIAGQKALVRKCAPSTADVPTTWANIERAGKILGWEPQTRCRDGLSAACQWYLANRTWAQEIPTSDYGR
jgi:UDP-glucuronate 4-epimerase